MPTLIKGLSIRFKLRISLNIIFQIRYFNINLGPQKTPIKRLIYDNKENI